jgi:tetratricopeptide (TPR) repeat protein
MKWLDENAGAPFFLFVHLFDLHTPYILPPSVQAKFPQGGYDAALSYVDDTLGRFWDFLEKKGLTRRALIVFLSDHGESLGDHGERTHGFFVYQSTMRVPLIFHWPAGAPAFSARVDRPVGLVDVTPSVLEFLGIPRIAQFQGRSTLDLVRGRAPAQEREIYGESLYAHNHLGCAGLMMLRLGRHTFVDAPKPELYDVIQDPHELRNIYESRKAIAAPLQQRLAAIRWTSAQPALTQKPLAPDAIQKLRSLGYLAWGNRAPALETGADPKDKIADYEKSRQAIVLTLSNRLPEALAMFESVLSRNPDFLDARNIMGLTQQKLGKHEDAIQTFRKVLEKDPANLAAHYNIGLSYTELRQLDPAVKELEVAVAIASSSGHAADQMTVPAEELLGRISLERKDYQGAKVHFDRLLQVAPGNFTAHYNLGWLATLQGNSQEGQRHLQAAIQADPESPLAHNALGNLYLRLGDLDRAHGEFQQAIRLNPKDAWGHYNLGVVFAKKNDRALAAAEFQKALDSDPNFAAAGEALKRLQNPAR